MMAQNHVLEDDDYEDEVDLAQEEETLLYFEGLVSRDEPARASWMANFDRSLKAWATRPEDPSAKKLLETHVPTALRFAVNSPFKDVRIKLGKILHELEEDCSYTVPEPLFDGPSSFIPKSDTVCYSCQDGPMTDTLSLVQGLYEETFLHDSRLSHIVLLLGFHPSYLSIFNKVHDFLMHGDGPLSLPVRNYLAILAASRHKCSYLVTMQEAEFLKNGGEASWLQGLQHLPCRILNLLTLNKMLAHQPWFLSPEHMKGVLRGADSWSISELVHAIVITAHFHALASFALGCGINPEIDTQLGHTRDSAASETSYPCPPFCTNPALGVGYTPPDSDISEPMSPTISPLINSHLTQAAILEHYIDSTDGGTDQKTLRDTITEKLKTMPADSSSDDEESAEQNNIHFESAASSLGLDSKKPSVSVPTPVSLVKYLEDPDFEHEDFTLSAAVTLRAREYSWEDHGFPFVSNLYPDIAPLLDEKFKLALEMTYGMCGQEQLDTKHFRQAIWYYIQSIKGIRHDDYHYRKVNQLLEIDFKTYVRMVACFPEKVTNFDFSNTMSGLEFSERVHVNILAMEARMQAELIYALRAIMAYMKQQTSQ